MVLAVVPEAQAKRVQSVLNAAARLVILCPEERTHNATPARASLAQNQGANPVPFARSLAYRCLNGTALSYLAEDLHLVADVSSRCLRSTSSLALTVSATRRLTLVRILSLQLERGIHCLCMSAKLP
jgi:hypothetical protein